MTARAFCVLLAAVWLVGGAHAQTFRADGPDSVMYGQRRGYPVCSRLDYLGDTGCRVGAFSHFDELFPARRIAAPDARSPLKRAEQSLQPAIASRLDAYLTRRPVTALLVARGDTILFEKYQYGRNDRHRLTSFSMAKTITGMLVGLALRDGAIRSLDDAAEAYVKELEGTAYGATPIRALLTMASGVAFEENYSSPSSDIYRLADDALSGAGALASVRQFNRRIAPPGERFSYSSAETQVLGLVLTAALRMPLGEYASEQLWKPMGAEADATWVIDAKGQEVTYAYFNAVLRDWARLGLMMARGGQWNDRQVLPAEWVETSTKPGVSPGYGYQVWINPTRTRTWQFRGLRGQFVFVDPRSKTVLVQTSLRDEPDAQPELMAIWRALIGEE
jgi:CubicO group peptidase (beta-lactamase class C family)